MLHRGMTPQDKENHCARSSLRVWRTDDSPTEGVTWAALTTKRAWTYGSARLPRL